MGASSLAFPVCTCLSSRCMPATYYEKEHPLKRSTCQSSKRVLMNLNCCLQTKKKIVSNKPPEKQRKIVVRGLGVATPLRHDTYVFYRNLHDGVSDIEGFDCSNLPLRIAGEIKSLPTDGLVSPKHARKANKCILYSFIAGKKALADAGITGEVFDKLNKYRCGIIIGTALGGMKTTCEALEALKILCKKVHPFSVPYGITSMGSAFLAIDLGWRGPNYSISSACATGNACILNAAQHIIKDIMLCGSSDATILPAGVAGFDACETLSRRNSNPTKASRPWDARDGFVVGEGAGVLVLEEMEHAKRRGANIYAEFLGGSFTSVPYEPYPNGMDIVSCMKKALARSGVAREVVNYINAHAISTPVGDLKEYIKL